MSRLSKKTSPSQPPLPCEVESSMREVCLLESETQVKIPTLSLAKLYYCRHVLQVKFSSFTKQEEQSQLMLVSDVQCTVILLRSLLHFMNFSKHSVLNPLPPWEVWALLLPTFKDGEETFRLVKSSACCYRLDWNSGTLCIIA